MMLHMFFERATVGRGIVAVRTSEWLLITMDPNMLLEITDV